MHGMLNIKTTMIFMRLDAASMGRRSSYALPVLFFPPLYAYLAHK